MEFIKLNAFIEQLDSLIRKECTGTADEFAQKLGVSERTLQNHLLQLRALGIEKVYDYTRKTDMYPQKGSITFQFIPVEMDKVKGGTGLLSSISFDNCTPTNLPPPENML